MRSQAVVGERVHAHDRRAGALGELRDDLPGEPVSEDGDRVADADHRVVHAVRRHGAEVREDPEQGVQAGGQPSRRHPGGVDHGLGTVTPGAVHQVGDGRRSQAGPDLDHAPDLPGRARALRWGRSRERPRAVRGWCTGWARAFLRSRSPQRRSRSFSAGVRQASGAPHDRRITSRAPSRTRRSAGARPSTRSTSSSIARRPCSTAGAATVVSAGTKNRAVGMSS